LETLLFCVNMWLLL